jgi:catechol 2,3-dioxygenase-like lactoylglutathione lyase family enzyme
MTVRALWIPFEVADLDAATRHYTELLNLSIVDEWEREGERGVVLRVADGAFVELVEPVTGTPPALAFQLASESDVDESHAAWPAGAETPHRFPRGHYGFTAPGPAGADVLVWSEK